MTVVPEFRGEEDLRTRNAGFLEARADFGLVLVDCGTIYVGVAVAKGDFYSGFDFMGLGLLVEE
jgi:hypothetical protein